MFQSLKRDHSSSDIAMFQGNVYVCTLKFQSLKRDHSSSDLLWKDSLASSSKVSIAQARPLLFRLHATLVRVPVTARFNRSSATIPLPTSRKLAGPRIVQKVSIAQARPFLFRPR